MTNKEVRQLINSRFKEVFKSAEANKFFASRKGVAESLGVSPQLLSEILNGRINVGVDILYRFCEVYNANITYLFHGVLPVFNPIPAEKGEVGLEGLAESKLLTVTFGSTYWDSEKKRTGSNGLLGVHVPLSFTIPNSYGIEAEMVAFRVGEPHMEPLIEQGMTIIAAKLNDKTLIENGQVYVLDTKKKGLIIRRLFWSNKEKGIVELAPENALYDSEELSLKEVNNLFKAMTFIGYDLTKRSALIQKHKSLNSNR